MEKTKYTYRQIARLTIEAATPLAVGTGAGNIVTDAPVARDTNGLPFIPATSMAGVIRHALEERDTDVDSVFGYHDKKGGEGSKVIFTDAVMVGAEGLPVDGLHPIDWSNPFYAHYQELPIRQHVRIGSDGTAMDTGKFDNEVVYAGTRFVFEMELLTETQGDRLREIAARLYDSTFRIGGRTRSGYGRLKVVDCGMATLDLTDEADLQSYLEKSSCLAKAWNRFEPWDMGCCRTDDSGWTRYVLSLSPSDFFLFGSGLGDEDADNTPVTEPKVEWTDGKPRMTARKILIPGASVKGALAHRTAYHYNKLRQLFADNSEGEKTEKQNPAVTTLFGTAGNGNGKDKDKQRGHVLIGDMLEADADGNTKVFFHNRIDAFTGGTVDGALFQEKSVYGKDSTAYRLEILVRQTALDDTDVKNAFEQALLDLCDGLLPLGGAVNRGYGIFTGTMTKE